MVESEKRGHGGGAARGNHGKNDGEPLVRVKVKIRFVRVRIRVSRVSVRGEGLELVGSIGLRLTSTLGVWRPQGLG